MDVLKQFTEKVSEKSELQRKYLVNWKATDSEKEDLRNILYFFMEELGYGIDYIVNAYLFINTMVMEETYYFIKNGTYRNSSFSDVNKIVYDNPDYMDQYMIGLCLSDFIWINHIKILRYFTDHIASFHGDKYLEIGPGFGQYLAKAVSYGSFKNYFACDISQTSVDRSNRYLKYRGLSEHCFVERADFFQYEADNLFDYIVMGEVLEHVEQPLLMLQKIHSLLKQTGVAFITTVINAPAVDHIFLFDSIDSVLNIAVDAGFKIAEYFYVTEGDIPLEKAVRKRKAINIAMILKKGE